MYNTSFVNRLEAAFNAIDKPKDVKLEYIKDNSANIKLALYHKSDVTRIADIMIGVDMMLISFYRDDDLMIVWQNVLDKLDISDKRPRVVFLPLGDGYNSGCQISLTYYIGTGD